MNDKELHDKVHSAMYALIKTKNVVSPVEVLIEIGVLSKTDYENWRAGKIPYLERACKTNLSKLSFVNREIRAFARKNNLKPSLTDYRKWGKGRPDRLRFSKSGNEHIEKQYATHYIGKRETNGAVNTRTT